MKVSIVNAKTYIPKNSEIKIPQMVVIFDINTAYV